MRLLVSALTLFAVMAVSAAAQPATVPAPVPVPAPSPVPAPPQQRQVEIPQSHAIAAREFITALRIPDQFQNAVPALIAQTAQRIVQSDIAIQGNAARRTALEESGRVVAEGLRGERDQLTASIAILYATRFTEAELRELTTFLRSPTGQKFVGLSGPLGQEAVAVANQWTDQMLRLIFDGFRAEMRQRGHPLN